MRIFERHVTDDLAAFEDQTLEAARRTQVQHHLDRCARCRAALEDVARGRRLLQSLPASSMSPAEVQRLTSRLQQPASTARAPVRSFALAAAIVLLVLTGAVAIRLRLASVPDIVVSSEPRGLERSGGALHERLGDGRDSLQFTSSSTSAVRRWLREQRAPEAQLIDAVGSPEQPALRVRGASVVILDGARASVVAYSVNGYAVTLVTARESDVPLAPRSGWLTKRVHARRANGHPLLTWSTSGQTYTIVSDLPGVGEHACFACHADREFRGTIERQAARLAVQQR